MPKVYRITANLIVAADAYVIADNKQQAREKFDAEVHKVPVSGDVEFVESFLDKDETEQLKSARKNGEDLPDEVRFTNTDLW